MAINWACPYASKVWKALRESHLWQQPYCVRCKSSINLNVDHIIEHQNNLNLFLNPANLQTLCVMCHAKKTNQFVRLKQLKPRPNFQINFVYHATKGLKITPSWDWVQLGLGNVFAWGGVWILLLNEEHLDFLKLSLLAEFCYAFFIKQNAYTLQLNLKKITSDFELSKLIALKINYQNKG